MTVENKTNEQLIEEAERIAIEVLRKQVQLIDPNLAREAAQVILQHALHLRAYQSKG